MFTFHSLCDMNLQYRGTANEMFSLYKILFVCLSSCLHSYLDEHLYSRKERPLSLGIFPMSGGGGGGGGNNSQIPDFLGRAETPGTEGWRFTDLSQHRSNASLKVLKPL